MFVCRRVYKKMKLVFHFLQCSSILKFHHLHRENPKSMVTIYTIVTRFDEIFQMSREQILGEIHAVLTP